MTVVLPEPVSRWILKYGFYEEALTSMVLAHLRPGDTFCDVGSHFGYFSLLAHRIVGERGEVHSFEPTPSTFRILEENVGQKRAVRLNNVAVFSDTCRLELTDYGTEFSAFNTVYGGRLPEEELSSLEGVACEVNAVSLDRYVEDNGVVPTFVKVDAEGAEYEILTGMRQTIRAFRPTVSVEVGDMGVAGVRLSRDVILGLMEEGYAALEYSDGAIREHRVRDRYEYDNILLVPK